MPPSPYSLDVGCFTLGPVDFTEPLNHRERLRPETSTVPSNSRWRWMTRRVSTNVPCTARCCAFSGDPLRMAGRCSALGAAICCAACCRNRARSGATATGGDANSHNVATVQLLVLVIMSVSRNPPAPPPFCSERMAIRATASGVGLCEEMYSHTTLTNGCTDGKLAVHSRLTHSILRSHESVTVERYPWRQRYFLSGAELLSLHRMFGHSLIEMSYSWFVHMSVLNC